MIKIIYHLGWKPVSATGHDRWISYPQTPLQYHNRIHLVKTKLATTTTDFFVKDFFVKMFLRPMVSSMAK